MTIWPFASSSFSGIMSRDHFSLVMRFLHLNDSTRISQRDSWGMIPSTRSARSSRLSLRTARRRTGDIGGRVHDRFQRPDLVHTVSPEQTTEVGDESSQTRCQDTPTAGGCILVSLHCTHFLCPCLCVCVNACAHA